MARNSLLIISISWVFLKLPNCLRSPVLSRLETCEQRLYSLSGDNNLVRFYFWWRKIALNYQKFYKCFVQDWRRLTVIRQNDIILLGLTMILCFFFFSIKNEKHILILQLPGTYIMLPGKPQNYIAWAILTMRLAS